MYNTAPLMVIPGAMPTYYPQERSWTVLSQEKRYFHLFYEVLFNISAAVVQYPQPGTGQVPQQTPRQPQGPLFTQEDVNQVGLDSREVHASFQHRWRHVFIFCLRSRTCFRTWTRKWSSRCWKRIAETKTLPSTTSSTCRPRDVYMWRHRLHSSSSLSCSFLYMYM